VNAANERVRRSPHFSEKDREHAVRIIQRIVKEDETRVDYLSDVLAIPRTTCCACSTCCARKAFLGDAKDLTAFLDLSPAGHPAGRFARYARLERELLPLLAESRGTVFLKETVERLLAAGVPDASVDALKDVLLYWETKSFIHKTRTDRATHAYQIGFRVAPEELRRRMAGRHQLAGWLAGYLAQKRENTTADAAKAGSDLLEFSLLELKAAFEGRPGGAADSPESPFEGADYEEALLYLNAIAALKLEGGF
jgi:ATP-dependent DNA helicase RecQ